MCISLGPSASNPRNKDITGARALVIGTRYGQIKGLKETQKKTSESRFGYDAEAI